MSASAIADGIVTMLTATSAFGTNGAATHYRVLESQSASCCVVSWRGLRMIPHTFGDPPDTERIWTFLIETFSKDTGNPLDVLSRTKSCISAVADVMAGDDTIQGTAENMPEMRAEKLPRLGLVIGGATWIPMDVEVDIREWP